MFDEQSLLKVEFDSQEFLRTLTSAPGVYRFFAANDFLLYVGKANNLKKRVASYFSRTQHEPRIEAMIGQIVRVETTVTRSEVEALVLENELIKSLQPRYNVLLRDDKSYPWIYLSSTQSYPRLAYHRGARSEKGQYFGPFPNGNAVRESLDLMQKLFRIRQCEDSFFRNRSRPCLQYQIGRCSAPCVAIISPEDYQLDVDHAAQFLSGRKLDVIENLAKSMDQAASALEFERAAILRDQIASLKQMQSKQSVVDVEPDADVIACWIEAGLACIHINFFREGQNLGNRNYFLRSIGDPSAKEAMQAFIEQYYAVQLPPRVVLISEEVEDHVLLNEFLRVRASGRAVELRARVRGERARVLELARYNARIALQTELASRGARTLRWNAMRELLGLSETATRIECFDISHTQGEATTASCVVFDPNGPVKSQYRRYNLAGFEPGDDYAAMREALMRRFKSSGENEKPIPDVLLIDGGKGQVGKALEVIDHYKLNPAIVLGISKGEDRREGFERLIRFDGHVMQPPSSHLGFQLLMHVRDEAHRFAIEGHRKRRQKTRDVSRLEDIEGIGPKRRSQLLRHFGGWQGVGAAGVEELSSVPGISRELAGKIYAQLHPQ